MRKHNTTTNKDSSSPEEGQSATYPDYSTDILRRNYKVVDDIILYEDFQVEEGNKEE